jgi:hypothetical protein
MIVLLVLVGCSGHAAKSSSPDAASPAKKVAVVAIDAAVAVAPAIVVDAGPPSEALTVVAKLVDKGKAVPQCAGGGHFTDGTVMKYEIVRVEKGTYGATALYVAHGCPSGVIGDSRRGPYPYKVGDTLHLDLVRGDTLSRVQMEETEDAFAKESTLPRYRVVKIDPITN